MGQEVFYMGVSYYTLHQSYGNLGNVYYYKWAYNPQRISIGADYSFKQVGMLRNPVVIGLKPMVSLLPYSKAYVYFI